MMNKRWIKFRFTMVEVALALAVLLIGISSIMVLFPVGISATRSAVANNNLADISEYLMSYLRAGCVAEWAGIAKSGTVWSAVQPSDYFFSNKIASGYDNVKDLGNDGIDLNSAAYEPTGTNDQRITENLYKIPVSVSDSGKANSIFLYKQVSGDIVDFAAVVKVWRDANSSFYFRKADDAIQSIASSSADLRPYATVLCVEISWPAEASYAQREKRFYRQEIFNEAYRYSY